MAYPTDFMIIISSPEDYPSWPAGQKLKRLEKVVAWHDYVLELNSNGKMPWVWGTHQIISKFEPSGNQGTLIAIFKSKSLADFSQMMENDPLRDCSNYITIPLTSLDTDFEEDVARLDDVANLQTSSAIGRLFAEGLAGMQRNRPPYYDPKNPRFAVPPNPPCNMERTEGADDPIEYFLYGTGLEDGAAWTDARRAMYTEKVKWWHAYNADLVKNGQVTHGWSTHIFCHASDPVKERKGAIMILTAGSFPELDELYGANPLIEEADFISAALRPIASQRAADQARLKRARAEIDG